MLHRIALATGIVLFSLTPAAANHAIGVHWAGDGQNLVLKVNTSITPQWDAPVATAISDWDQSTELTLHSQTVVTDRRKCNPIVGEILVCDFSYGQTGWLALATEVYRIADNHIVFANVRLNDTYSNIPRFGNKGPDWRQIAACQELGHTFGLAHQDEVSDNVNLGSCMDYTFAPAGGVVEGFDYGPSNLHPNAHDYDELSIIYDHDDGFTTSSASATNFGIREVGKAAPQAQSAPGLGDVRAAWGYAVHRDKQGRPDVFLKDVGNGQQAMTHVYWAVGEGSH
jgi:hypothetical protein